MAIPSQQYDYPPTKPSRIHYVSALASSPEILWNKRHQAQISPTRVAVGAAFYGSAGGESGDASAVVLAPTLNRQKVEAKIVQYIEKIDDPVSDQMTGFGESPMPQKGDCMSVG